ncbi:MAG: prepilin-type N-terminal cleavage/methylation domain-containing protein [Myxococcota bacterium]
MTPAPRALSTACERRRRAGFTLIEVIAVVAIIAMVFAFGIPRLGGPTFDPLHNEADEIAERLRYARQRAVLTGVPHRLMIDLEEGGYLVEWYVTEERAAGRGSDAGGGLAALFAAAYPALAASDGPLLDFVPPRKNDELDYYPIPNAQMGGFRWLEDTLYFVGVAGPTGWVESGDFAIVFYADGTTEPLALEIADGDDARLTLEVEALLDRVRVREGRARS